MKRLEKLNIYKENVQPGVINPMADKINEIIELMNEINKGSIPCTHCNRIQDLHCGHQYWCYDNYHSKNPTKYTP